MTLRTWRVLPAVYSVLAAVCMFIAVPNANSGAQPVGTSGASYGEWAARWWEWALSIPAARNPILDQTGANCAEGQVGNVWFLAGTFGGNVTRSCDVPAGKPLFFPLINGAAFAPKGQETTLDLRLQVAPFIEGVTDLECTIDGNPCAGDLFAFRAQSPIFEAIVPPHGLIPPKFYDPMVADGYWVLLDPLSPGDHTLVFGGASGNFATTSTYHLHVSE